MNTPIQMTMIGTGGMAQYQLRHILGQFPQTHIPVVCEPSATAYEEVAAIFVEHGRTPPINEPDLQQLLATYGPKLDAAFIITPHVFHHDQAVACLEAGLDVLLEKPMVVNQQEAQNLIDVRDKSQKLLVVGFTGSLSQEIRTAKQMLESGELGNIQTISATVWQNWQSSTVDTWRQVPAVSGGGFLFDTGAHMLNTVADLAGEDFVEVAAWLDNNGSAVDILGAAMARLQSGTLVTFHACGDTIPSCASDVRIFCEKGILNLDVWGNWLRFQRPGEFTSEPVDVPAAKGVWGQFLAVRHGVMENPSPPEVGLRMARLWDAIQASAASGGHPVSCGREPQFLTP